MSSTFPFQTNSCAAGSSTGHRMKFYLNRKPLIPVQWVVRNETDTRPGLWRKVDIRITSWSVVPGPVTGHSWACYHQDLISEEDDRWMECGVSEHGAMSSSKQSADRQQQLCVCLCFH
ncbi:hypothetical protein ILYODFUR_022845 [Ilyodon furcidens]|uniref:Uncharacterized protein n=1 Tax=Ilyodon furcidens TaxID=33524 RepID=A0ABV0UME1_9TELE